MPVSSSAFKRTNSISVLSSGPRPVGELQLLDDKTGQVISSWCMQKIRYSDIDICQKDGFIRIMKL